MTKSPQIDELKEYFENRKGTGILATADSGGNVSAALYSRPHVMEDGSLAFIMGDRRSLANVRSNPRACFLFREEGGYDGVRLYLEMAGEEKNSPLIDTLRRGTHGRERTAPAGDRYLVRFRVTGRRPLVGDGEESPEE